MSEYDYSSWLSAPAYRPAWLCGLVIPAANTLRGIGEGGVTTEPRKAGDDANNPGMAAVTPVLSIQEVSDAEIIRQSWEEPERFRRHF